MSQSVLSSSRLTVDLNAIQANYKRLCHEVADDCKVAGIIKANAYGLGYKDIISVLEQEDCPFYFVATLEEGIKARALTFKPIAVLNGLFHNCESLYVEHNLVPVLNTAEELERWQDMSLITGERLPAALHFDTGMNRLGFKEENWPENLNRIDPVVIMSHFACADELDHPVTIQQFRRFMKVAEKYLRYGSYLSLSNSSGVFRNKKYHFNMVRPGMALYGLNPTPEAKNPMNSAISLETRILQINDLKAGETVGYGCSYTVPENTKSATISIGYADGFLRSGSNKNILYWQNQPCPVIGRISMDLVTVDLSKISGPLPKPGDWLEIIGPNKSADDLAQESGTIGYEILTSLGARYERRVINTSNKIEKRIKAA